MRGGKESDDKLPVQEGCVVMPLDMRLKEKPSPGVLFTSNISINRFGCLGGTRTVVE